MDDKRDLKQPTSFSSIHNTSKIPKIEDDPRVVVNEAFESQKQAFNAQENKIERLEIKEEVVEQPIIQQPVQEPIIQEEPVLIPIEEPPKKVKRHMKKGVKIILFLLILLCVAAFGAYKFNKEYLNNPKVITGKAFGRLGNDSLEFLNLPEKETLIGDNFTIKSNVTYSLESQIVGEGYLTDPKMLEYFYDIYNLNNSKDTYVIKQNLDSKQFYFTRKLAINNKPVIDDRYLIKNSTEYYFLSGFTPKYVNNGNNTYFESLTSKRNAIDNIKYVYKKALSSIADNIDNDDFSISHEDIEIDGVSKNAKKVSIELSNKKAIKTINNTIEDLKKDNTSYTIISGVYDNFDKYKLSNKTNLVGESIKINVYSIGVMNDVKRIDLILENKDTITNYQYDIEEKELKVIENDNIKYDIVFNKTDNNSKATIYNESKTSIGSIELDKGNNKRYYFDFHDNIYDITIEAKDDISKKTDTSYNSNMLINLNLRKNKKSMLSGKIKVASEITNKAKIEVDTDDVMFASEITDEQMELLEPIIRDRLGKTIIG